jgi:hypothetical protein
VAAALSVSVPGFSRARGLRLGCYPGVRLGHRVGRPDIGQRTAQVILKTPLNEDFAELRLKKGSEPR